MHISRIKTQNVLYLALQILLQLGDRRQAVDIQNFKCLEDLVHYTQVHFDVSQNWRIYFQKFESDWNEHVEISDVHQIKDKDKVIAVLDGKVKSTDGDSGGDSKLRRYSIIKEVTDVAHVFHFIHDIRYSCTDSLVARNMQ